MGVSLLVLLFLISEIMGTVAGFGSSAFFISLGQFVFGFKTTLVLTSIQHVFGNITKIALFHKTLDWKLIGIIGVPSLILTILGAWLSTHINASYSNVILGLFLMGISTYFLKFEDVKLPVTNFNAIVGGGLAGLFAGTIGTGGAIRGILLSSFNLEKNLYVGTSAAIDLAVDASRTIIYLDLGYLDNKYFYLIWILMGIAIIGSSAGKFILDRISQQKFRRVTLLTLFFLGTILLFKEINTFIYDYQN